MLSIFRKNIKTIIWVIVLSFVAWGIGTLSVSTQSSSPYAGSVRGQKITQKEFMLTMRFYELLTRAQQKNSEKLSEPLTYDELRALSWQTIVVSREAKNQGIKITDEDIKAEIEKLFSIDERFSLMMYQDWIRKNFDGRSRDFEEIIRKHLAVQKIRQKVLAGVPDDERNNQWLKWLTDIIGNAQLKDFTAKPQS